MHRLSAATIATVPSPAGVTPAAPGSLAPRPCQCPQPDLEPLSHQDTTKCTTALRLPKLPHLPAVLLHRIVILAPPHRHSRARRPVPKSSFPPEDGTSINLPSQLASGGATYPQTRRTTHQALSCHPDSGPSRGHGGERARGAASGIPSPCTSGPVFVIPAQAAESYSPSPPWWRGGPGGEAH